jgi:steroid 5-alpha reductase family enzyme
MLSIYAETFGVVVVFMALLWIYSVRIRNASIVDSFWGVGFVLQVWVYFALTPDGFLARKLLIGAIVTLWGLRLSIHIYRRNHGKPEDFRYQEFRRRYGPGYWWISFFQVFLLQGILMFIIGTPLLPAQISSTPEVIAILDILGLIVWIIGFYFESVGDAQLARFRADPNNKGKLLNTGLWAYTRHPNYFGDAAQWWGFYLIALSAGGWRAIFSPILMTLLLIKVSGVGLLEKTLAKTKPGYQAYMQTTSAFIPWLPRKQRTAIDR